MVIPEGVQAIPKGAFRNAASLTIVELPSSLNAIGENAFRSCFGLLHINFGSALKTVGKNTFSGVSAELTIYGAADTYAQTYADENSIAFSTEPMPWPTVTLSRRIIDPDFVGAEDTTVSFWLDGNLDGESAAVVHTDAWGRWRFTDALCGRLYRITYECELYDLASYALDYSVGWEDSAVQNVIIE